MYSDKRAKVSSSEMPAYSNLISEACAVDGPEIPVPGYFRLSQTYTTAKNQDYSHETSTTNSLMQLNRLTPKPHSASFVEAEKKVPEIEEQETRSPSPDKTGSSQEEKSNTAEAPVLSPELPRKEAKGGYNKKI